jgi:hypothetical protein
MQHLLPFLVVKKQRVAGMQHAFGWAQAVNCHEKQLVIRLLGRGIVLAI